MDGYRWGFRLVWTVVGAGTFAVVIVLHGLDASYAPEPALVFVFGAMAGAAVVLVTRRGMVRWSKGTLAVLRWLVVVVSILGAFAHFVVTQSNPEPAGWWQAMLLAPAVGLPMAGMIMPELAQAYAQGQSRFWRSSNVAGKLKPWRIILASLLLLGIGLLQVAEGLKGRLSPMQLILVGVLIFVGVWDDR